MTVVALPERKRFLDADAERRLSVAEGQAAAMAPTLAELAQGAPW